MIQRIGERLWDWLEATGAPLRNGTIVALIALFVFFMLLRPIAGAPFAPTELVTVDTTVEKTVPVEVTVEKTVEIDAERARQICRDEQQQAMRDYNDAEMEWIREGKDLRDFPQERPKYDDSCLY